MVPLHLPVLFIHFSPFIRGGGSGRGRGGGGKAGGGEQVVKRDRECER